MPLLLAVEAFGFRSGLTDLPLCRFGASLLSWAGLVATFLSIPLLSRFLELAPTHHKHILLITFERLFSGLQHTVKLSERFVQTIHTVVQFELIIPAMKRMEDGVYSHFLRKLLIQPTHILNESNHFENMWTYGLAFLKLGLKNLPMSLESFDSSQILEHVLQLTDDCESI